MDTTTLEFAHSQGGFFDPKFAGIALLAWIPLLPLLGAFINLVFGRWFSRRMVQTVAIAAVAAAFGLVAYLVFYALFHQVQVAAVPNPADAAHPFAVYLPQWKLGGIEQNVFTWIQVGDFTAELTFHLDSLSAVMVLIITFVGTWIHIYSTGYMSHEPRYAAYFGYLNLFMGAMLILVLGSSLPVMFIGWEGVGLCSFLLIGFWFENDAYATAGRKAFVVNRIGDFCFLLGMFLLFAATRRLGVDPSHLHGSLDFSTLRSTGFIEMADQPNNWFHEHLAAIAGIFLFVGACGKSAQIPLYVWLPDAMAGPTPVSALIHAATMVTAGVYMICRLSFLYASSTTALAVVAIIGCATALAAAFMAFAQTDLKKVLAYSTVSQLGFMFVAAGTGNWTAAIFHLGTHAFFKACLFLGAGSVMHGMEHGGSHTPGDIRTMGGLRKHMPITRITFLISCLAIAGIFPFSGFFSKDDILAGAFHAFPPGWGAALGKILWLGLSIAALGTAFYMWRLYFLVFSGTERSEEAKHAHESPKAMTSALVILAGFTCIIGFLGAPKLKSVELPSPLHALSSWLAPSVSHEWTWAEYDRDGKPHQFQAPIEGQPPQPEEVMACARAIRELDTCKLDGGVEGVCVGEGPIIAAAYDSTQDKFVDRVYDEESHAFVETATDPATQAAIKKTPSKSGLACEPASDTGTFALLAIALAIGLSGIGMAWMLYGRGPSPTVTKLVEGPLAGAYEASKNKLWVDEIYDAVFVRPFKAIARGLFEIVDRFIIDTVAVNGVAFVVGLFSRLSRWFQNGQIQRYLVGLMVGAALVFYITGRHREPTFEYEPAANGMIHFHADPGAGIMSANSKYQWDLDGDGKPDPHVDGADITVRFDDVGSTVTLWIIDPTTGEKTKVEQVVELPSAEPSPATSTSSRGEH